jgi:hypothetical protein
MIRRLLGRLIFLVQLVAVVVFIVFEEIVWETIAKPIYEAIRNLRLLQWFEHRLARANRYVVLLLFMVLLLGVEAAGVAAGVLALKGNVVIATILYGLKIPIAGFTFWLFHASESKLLSFGWFRWGYEKIIAFFAWIKTREIYRQTVEIAAKLKRQIRTSLRRIKERYFSGDNTLAKRFRRLYRVIKKALKPKRDQR